VCSLIGLNIFEAAFGVSNRIELLPCFAAMCGATYFPCHVPSPFVAVNDLTLDWILFFSGEGVNKNWTGILELRGRA